MPISSCGLPICLFIALLSHRQFITAESASLAVNQIKITCQFRTLAAKIFITCRPMCEDQSQKNCINWYQFVINLV